MCFLFFLIPQSLDFLQYILPPLPHQVALEVRRNQIHISQEAMTRKLTSWRPPEFGLTALGWDRLSDRTANPIPSHRSMLSGLGQCWQQRQCVAQRFWTGCLDPQQPTGLQIVLIHFLPCERIIQVHVIAHLKSGQRDSYGYRSLKYSASLQQERLREMLLWGKGKGICKGIFLEMFFPLQSPPSPCPQSGEDGSASVTVENVLFVLAGANDL